MHNSKRFAEICNEARRERSECFWALIAKLLAAPRTLANKVQTGSTRDLQRVAAG
jgi:hypothetical protein